MRVEAVFYPASRFTNLEDPNSRERFMDLMQSQYGFTEKELEMIVANTRKQLYWQKAAPRLLALVANKDHKRAGQLGAILAYSNGKFRLAFGDTLLEPLSEEDILVIEKRNIFPQANITVRFLDDEWRSVVQEGKLVAYEENRQRSGGEPFGWYLVEVEGETQRIEDWTIMGGQNYRFVLGLSHDS